MGWKKTKVPKEPGDRPSRAARRAALRRLRGPGGAVAPGALFPFPLVSNVFILCGVQTGLFRTGILSNNTYILVFPCQRGIIRE